MTPQTLNSLKSDHLPDANSLSYEPLSGSKKFYVQGQTRPHIQVPFREIELADTTDHKGNVTPNIPVRLYDTSGPYTDPSVKVDITQGLPQMRLKWILERGDVEFLKEPSSHYRKQRDNDIDL